MSLSQEELGFRVQERMAAQIVSVVVDVTERGEAKSKGVSVGCVIAGINYEPYLSRAHTSPHVFNSEHVMSQTGKNQTAAWTASEYRTNWK